MSDSWYYVNQGKAVGPLTAHQLKGALARSQNWKDTLVWRDGLSEWQKAVSLSEVAGLFAPVPPPIPREHKVGPSDSPAALPAQAASKWSIGKVVCGIGVFVAVIIGAAFGKVIGRGVSEAFMGSGTMTQAQRDAAIEEGLTKSVLQAKSMLPKKVDESTTWIDYFHQGKLVTYLYEMDSKNNEIPSTFITEARKIVAPKACNEKKMVELMAMGVTFRYSYRASDSQKILGSFVIAKADCANR